MNSLLSSFSGLGLEAGCDEVGRGCLAGPVVAAAVVLPEHYQHAQIKDSKKIAAKKREEIATIISKEALAYSIGMVSVYQIDQINILHASIGAMHQALEQLKIIPHHIIVDGNYFTPFYTIPHTTMIKGDGRYLSIAAASIIAKVYRDRLMATLHTKYPMYGWDKNKGYGTKEHLDAIAKYGLSPYHRRSFCKRWL